MDGIKLEKSVGGDGFFILNGVDYYNAARFMCPVRHAGPG